MKNIQKNGRIAYFDTLRLVLIFLVVTGHLLESFGSKSGAYKLIYLFHMPLFAYISGYFSSEKKAGEKGMIYFLLYVICDALFVVFEVYVLKNNVYFRLFAPRMGLWYLLAMAFWSLMTPVFRAFPAIPMLVFSFVLAFYTGTELQGATVRAFTFLPFFALGYYAKRYGITVKRGGWCKIAAIAVILAISLFILIFPEEINLKVITGNMTYAMQGYSSNWRGIVNRALWYAAAFAMCVSIMQLIPDRELFISYMGRNTLSVYILHFPICLAMKKLWGAQIPQYKYMAPFLAAVIVLVFGQPVFMKLFEPILRLGKKKNVEIVKKRGRL